MCYNNIIKNHFEGKSSKEGFIMCFRKKQSDLELNGITPMENGIKIYSSRHKGYFCEATIDKEGRITTKWISKDKKAFSCKEDLLNVFILSLKFFPLAVIIMLIVQYSFLLFIRLLLLTISLSFISIYYKRILETKKKGNNYFKFHSAANMTVNAFKKLNRPPTAKELRDFSHYSSYSSSAGIAFISIHFLFLFAVTFLPFAIKIIFLLIEYPFLKMLYDKGKLNFLQKFDTEDPTDTELEVAAIGIKKWYDNEIKDDK